MELEIQLHPPGQTVGGSAAPAEPSAHLVEYSLGLVGTPSCLRLRRGLACGEL